jgi:hypothetical protein
MLKINTEPFKRKPKGLTFPIWSSTMFYCVDRKSKMATNIEISWTQDPMENAQKYLISKAVNMNEPKQYMNLQ